MSDTPKNYAGLSSLQIFLDNIKAIFAPIDHEHEVDTELSPTSMNPVANKVIDEEFTAVAEAMSALDLAIDHKADSAHEHNISDISGLQDALNSIESGKGSVKYDSSQELTDAQRARARYNIGAVGINDIYDNDLIEIRFTWDGDTDNRDTFILNIANEESNTVSQYNYYKVSDNVPNRRFMQNLNEAIEKRSDGEEFTHDADTLFSGLYFDESFFSIGSVFFAGNIFFIEAAGSYNIEETIWFDAPSTGVYFVSTPNVYTKDLLLSASYKTGLCLNSTEDVIGGINSKRFTVRVSDGGALKTVDSDGNVVWDGSDIAGTIITDTSLSKSGDPADAAVTGKLINNLNESKVPTARTINGKALDEDVVLCPSDIGAADANETNNRLAAVEGYLSDLLYKKIEVSFFRCAGSSTYYIEKGGVLKEAKLTWSTSKEPTKLILKDNSGFDSGELDTKLTEYQAPNTPITSNRTWTLAATDERNHTATATAKVEFCNGLYYGVVEDGVQITSDLIGELVAQGKLTKKIQPSLSINKFTVTTGPNERILFAHPNSLGTPKFVDIDEGVGFSFVLAHTSLKVFNSNQVSDLYDVYLSENVDLGLSNIQVSKLV